AEDWTSIYGDAGGLVGLPLAVAELAKEAEFVALDTRLGDLAVHQHYDAAPWNVHLDGGKPVMIDWETDDLRPSDCLGPALADAAYLATYWYFLVCGARSDDAEEAALLRLFAMPATADPAAIAARA